MVEREGIVALRLYEQRVRFLNSTCFIAGQRDSPLLDGFGDTTDGHGMASHRVAVGLAGKCMWDASRTKLWASRYEYTNRWGGLKPSVLANMTMHLYVMGLRYLIKSEVVFDGDEDTGGLDQRPHSSFVPPTPHVSCSRYTTIESQSGVLQTLLLSARGSLSSPESDPRSYHALVLLICVTE